MQSTERFDVRRESEPGTKEAEHKVMAQSAVSDYGEAAASNMLGLFLEALSATRSLSTVRGDDVRAGRKICVRKREQ